MNERRVVAAGIIDVLCAAAETNYGMTRSELLYVGALEPEDMRDPAGRLAAESFLDILLYVLKQSGDRSLGIRFAEAMDLRTQGFWGYLMISSLTLRQAAELLLRFHHLRRSSRITFWVEQDWVIFEHKDELEVPTELEAVLGDGFLASSCYYRRRWVPKARGEMQAWVTYPEEPHHRELRALVGGPITFNAPFNRFRLPVRELDLPLGASDPHLLRLAEEQLEQQLARVALHTPAQDAAELVRSLLIRQLQEGASIERVAHELHLSVRTLRRRLRALDVTFQHLLEEVRQHRAVEYLTKTEEALERVAERLGYMDPSNFRRAFRRWTGQSPAAYRAAHAARPERSKRAASRASEPPKHAVSLASETPRRTPSCASETGSS